MIKSMKVNILLKTVFLSKNSFWEGIDSSIITYI